MQKFNSIILSSVVVLTGVMILMICVFLLPNVAQNTVHSNPEITYLQYPILLGMYATAVPFLYAIYETVIMIQIINRESMFSSRIIQGLNAIKYCAYVIIGLYVIGFFILDTANALPPLVALLGIIITTVSLMVATGAVFIKNVLLKNQLSL